MMIVEEQFARAFASGVSELLEVTIKAHSELEGHTANDARLLQMHIADQTLKIHMAALFATYNLKPDAAIEQFTEVYRTALINARDAILKAESEGAI